MAIRIKKESIGNIETVFGSENPTLESKNEDGFIQESISFYFQDVYDAQKFNRFVKKCENMFRSSEYYSRYIGSLKGKGLNFCSVRGNITDEDADIEFHHYPFTLYDITRLIMLDKIQAKENFSSFSIVNELIQVHAENLVGLVPLSVTEHQLVHDGIRSIPWKSVYGRVADFVVRYSHCMDDDLIEKYNVLINMK